MTSENEPSSPRKNTVAVILLIIVAIVVTAIAWTGVSFRDLFARF